MTNASLSSREGEFTFSRNPGAGLSRLAKGFGLLLPSKQLRRQDRTVGMSIDTH